MSESKETNPVTVAICYRIVEKRIEQSKLSIEAHQAVIADGERLLEELRKKFGAHVDNLGDKTKTNTGST